MVGQSVTKSPRIEMVDALRGFAVMAIILVHNLEHFIFPVYPENTPEWLGVLDKGPGGSGCFIRPSVHAQGTSDGQRVRHNAAKCGDRRFCRMTGDLRFYGRMSLTNYISQSVIGALIYFPFGLYLAPHCGYTVSLLIGIFTFLLQVRFCKWWLGRHRQGPLEYIWHKWTWINKKK